MVGGQVVRKSRSEKGYVRDLFLKLALYNATPKKAWSYRAVLLGTAEAQRTMIAPKLAPWLSDQGVMDSSLV